MILRGDCIEVMGGLPAGSVDMVLADVPYGQTQNDWDQPIPFAPMWEQLRRVAKPDAAIVLMAAQPFASKLVCSNLADFRYDLIWQKNKPTGFLNANRQPLRNHEHILVFYRKAPFYAAQKTQGHEPLHRAVQTSHGKNYGAKTQRIESGGNTDRFPTSVIPMPIINNDDPDKRHPTQKPVGLMAWLIRSYTAPGQTVLDFTAGSGTTAIAAMREGRQFICIEQEPAYIEIAEARVAAERGAAPLLAAQ
jgi:DNA modification methylase